ncbi:hypothetical protein J5893_04955 [bacterium]|nr:hypothetical protein [bacterium]
MEYAKEKHVEQLFGNTSDLGISSGMSYSAKDKEKFIQYLKDHGLYDKAADIPFHKINSLIKS